jgi:hypothetical protein
MCLIVFCVFNSVQIVQCTYFTNCLKYCIKRKLRNVIFFAKRQQKFEGRRMSQILRNFPVIRQGHVRSTSGARQGHVRSTSLRG